MSNLLPLKHWLCTLLLGPVFILLYFILTEYRGGNIAGIIILYPVFFIYSIFFSLPALAIHYILFLLLRRLRATGLVIRICLSVAAITCIVFTFTLMKGSQIRPIAAAYSFAAFLTGALLNTEKTDDAESTADTIFH
jgi:hypothetical protein